MTTFTFAMFEPWPTKTSKSAATEDADCGCDECVIKRRRMEQPVGALPEEDDNTSSSRGGGSTQVADTADASSSTHVADTASASSSDSARTEVDAGASTGKSVNVRLTV